MDSLEQLSPLLSISRGLEEVIFLLLLQIRSIILPKSIFFSFSVCFDGVKGCGWVGSGGGITFTGPCTTLGDLLFWFADKLAL